VNKHRCDCGNKKELKVANESSYWIWDLESFTEPVIWREGNEIDKPTSVSEHKVIFVAACNMADPTDSISFYGEDCLDEFLKSILQDKKFKGTTFLAHNAGGYGCQFVMRWIERHGHKPKTIPSPTSLYRPLHLEHDGVRFIDSWNFITTPLSKFGKCFGLPQSKSDFPHGFSTRGHLEYRGPMPAVDSIEDYYSLNHIKGCSLQETEQLRAKQKDTLLREARNFYSPINRCGITKNN
jgi:hypothetical protein